jgi:hypothetical protein
MEKIIVKNPAIQKKPMSIHTSLDDIVKYAQGAFIQAKSDGVLEAGEVVQIAVGVAGRLQALGDQLRGSEKKSVVMYCLKKGMDAAGGIGELPGLKGASVETRKAVEDQLLAAAGAAIDMAVAVAQGKLDLKKGGVKACLPFCLSAATVVQALLPKEAALVKQAVGWAQEQGKAYAAAMEPVEKAVALPETSAPIQESAAVVAAPAPPAATPVKDTPPATAAETEPSPAASPEDAPAQTHEVRFE